MAPPAEQDPGAKYDVRQRIGQGAFGSAFLVTNKQDKADYVLKKVRLAKQTKWQRNSTLQERDLATSLRHPFIIPCVESWVVQDHTVNMIYAYCQNGDLSSYLTKIRKQEGQVDEGLMQKWLCQLLLALDYLQTQQVLHRDIKTSNLMLTCDNDVALGDFGLATLMEPHGDESRPQDTNLVGTPHYMSPELLSCKAYGFKTDVWSLGCVFYELTAQRPTFNAFNIHGLVSKIKKNKLAPLPTSYSTDWRDVIELMLCKKPDRRPSVQQLMALPCLRPAMLEARARARELMPSVPLPPLLDPTPLTPLPLSSEFRLSCGQQDVADEYEGSAGSASDQAGCARSGGGGCGSDAGESSRASGRRSAPGLTAVQAVQASELSALWKANFGQQEQLDTERPEQQATADAELAEVEQQQQSCLEQTLQARQHHQTPCNAFDSPAAVAGSSGRCVFGDVRSAGSPMGSSSSSAAALAPGQLGADAKGLGVGYSPRGAAGVIDGYKRIATPSKQGHINQPGIRRTPSERVAAAIAAAGAAPAATQAAAAAEAASGRVTPDLCPREGSSPASHLLPRRPATNSSTSSSRGATPGLLTPQQQQCSESSTPGQASPASVTPRLPGSNSSSSAKQRSPASTTGTTPRQDSARRHRHSAFDCSRREHSSTARPQTALQAGQQTGTEGDAAARTASAGAARPLSAPRSSSVRRTSEKGPQQGQAGAGAKQQQQRPGWGAGGGRSCLTPGRQRPEPSPLLKAVKAASGSATLAPGMGGEAAAGILADVVRRQRRSHGQLSPMPSEQPSAQGAGSPATDKECAAQSGAPTTQQQQQHKQPVVRRSSSGSTGAADRGAAAAKQAAAAAVAAGEMQQQPPAHGLPRSARHSSPAGGEQQQQQQVEDAGPSSQGIATTALPQQPRSAPGAAALPPLPLYKLQAINTQLDIQQQQQLSPIPLASPVYGQDRPAPAFGGQGQVQETPVKQQQPGFGSSSLGSDVIAPAAAAAAAGPTPSRRALHEAQQRGRSAGGTSSSTGQAAGSSASEAEDERTQRARAALAAVCSQVTAGSSQKQAAEAAAVSRKPTVGSISSRRISAGSASSSRRSSSRRSSSSGNERGTAAAGSLTDRGTGLLGQAAGDSPAAAGGAAGLTATPQPGSGGSTAAKQEQQQHQQRQGEQQLQAAAQPPAEQQQQLLQRLEVLESALMVIGGLVERKRWTELSTVMRSDSLRPSSLGTGPGAASVQQQPSAADVLKLGDIVVLGRSRSIRGKIRYIGPVAWDASASDWVGMELDRPCGVDGTQRGLTYFDCPPHCASFHKATELTTLGA